MSDNTNNKNTSFGMQILEDSLNGKKPPCIKNAYKDEPTIKEEFKAPKEKVKVKEKKKCKSVKKFKFTLGKPTPYNTRRR